MKAGSAANATACRWRTVFWARGTGDDDGLAGRVVDVDVAVVEAPPNLWFLEHVFDRSSGHASRELVARAGTTLYLSEDLGETWRPIDEPTGLLFSLCFTTAEGRRLLQDIRSPEVHVFDPGWRYLGARTAGAHPWHGTWSIDQSKSGVVMFCEYASLSPTLRVLRSLDDGDSWECVFSQPGHDADPAAGPIRHFHTCQADPFLPGRWYLSSGDRGKQNTVWLSDDDGRSWQLAEVALASSVGPPIPDGRLPNIVRHTSEVITEDAVIWPTDDNLGSVARLVRAAKPDLARADIIASFGKNELRNIVSLGDDGLFILSESKLDPSVAEAYCVGIDGRVFGTFALPNPAGTSATVARSRSSKSAIDGVFFSFSDLALDGKPALLRWTVTVAAGDERDAARQQLLARRDDARNDRGDADAEAAVLEEAYRLHFQCNICSDELEETFLTSQRGDLPGLYDPARFTEARRVEYACPHCASRIRQRTARILVGRRLQNRGGRLLLVSTARHEQRWFRARYESVTHISLEGEFGDPEIVVGADLRQMPQIPSERYDLMYASCVLDYIPELDEVAREALRVLAPGGEFAFFIMPYRLIDGGTGCVVKHRNALAHEAYAQRPDGGETGVPSCEFGVEYIREVFATTGFDIEAVPVFDPLSRTEHRWWVARKQPRED